MVENQKDASMIITTSSNNTLVANLFFYKRFLFKASLISNGASIYSLLKEGTQRNRVLHTMIEDTLSSGEH
jgi:hypothetical protein